MSLREIIKELCKSAGISLNKLEQNLKFAKGYMSKLDKSTPNSAKLNAIADFFCVSTDYLLEKNKDEIYEVEYKDEYNEINHIKDYLKESREDRGYTIEELSKKTGIAEKVLKAYEDDKSDIEVKSNLFKKILKTYDITQLDFEDEHNELRYEARPEFHGDYNASFAFDKALEQDQALTSLAFSLTAHEGDVIAAYRQQTDMQPAVDRLLGVSSKASPGPQLLAAHNDDNDETQQELMNKDIERIKNIRKK